LKEHRYIILKTESKTNIYEVFSVFIETKDWTYTNIKFKDDDDWLEHINKLKEKSIHKTDIELNKDDEILVLQTCSTKKEYLKFKKKFLLVIARKVDNI
jgi:sortase B